MKFVSRLPGLVRKDSKKLTEDSGTSDDKSHTLPLNECKNTFKYEKNVCALSWWEPLCLLEEGSISDIHLVKRRDHFVKVRYKDKRNVMDLAKKQSSNSRGAITTDESAQVYVLKSVMKDHVGDDLVLDEMRSEIHTMSKLNHPNICNLVEAYERRRHIYLVMEYCSGGNLAGRIPMPEKTAALVCKKVLSAVKYMHGLGVAHRDIKLENIMVDSKGEIKLIDFGLATAYLSGDYNNMTDKVGTLYSMAPQVLAGNYDESCDLWSVGVVSYLLLSGKQPFWGPSGNKPWHVRRKIMMERIKKCQYAPMNTMPWQSISEAGKDFVRSLLQLNPEERPTASEALESKWIASLGEEEEGNAFRIDTEHDEQRQLLGNLRRRTWRLLSSRLKENEIHDLRAYLESHDEDGTGLITVKELRQILEDLPESTHLTEEDVALLFVDCKGLDMLARLNYVDLMVEVLVGRGRNMVDEFAKALDDLDTEGSRTVSAEDVYLLIDKFVDSELRDDIRNDLEVVSGMVNTSAVLEIISKRVTRHHRESVHAGS